MAQQTSQPDWPTLLAELQRIADALENPPDIHPPEVNDALLATATANVDYLAVRQLMKRVPRRNEPQVLVLAGCDRSKGAPPLLVLDEIPEDTASVAVFTGRGDPADVVDVSTHATTFATNQASQTYQLPNVGIDQDITRVEFRRADDFPLGIAQRLPA